MKKSNSIAIQNEFANSGSKYQDNQAESSFGKCVIADDTTRKLDFLILVIETLQINATDSLLLKARDIGLNDHFSSRVHFWKMRCSNPMRNTYTFTSLTTDQIDSLAVLISSMAENLYPLIRQLLSSKEPRTLNEERWSLFTTRLKSLIRERMNTQRSYIATLLSEENSQFFRDLLVILSLSCGESGAKRLKASLYYQY
tara:strand:- start:375 stop:971 length:597 start_codon:yes stop_codon:yes gene_type:complete